MKQFLIIQTAFLGDAVLVTSIVEKLHTLYPAAAIDVVVRKGNEGLFGMRQDGGKEHTHPFLRTVFVWDKGAGKTRSLFRLIGELRKVKYDHIINAQRFFSTGLMSILARGDETIGYDKNPLSFLFSKKVKHVIGDGRHEVDRLNALIEHLTDGTRPLPKLYPSTGDRAAVEAVLGSEVLDSDERYITIAPASVWHTKQWPAEKWVALIRALPQDHRVFLIGAPNDASLCERIAAGAGRGKVLAGRLSLLGTAALMEGAEMNYVNDSAPLHIASALNAPATVVYCSTVPAFGFGPLRANGRVVETAEKLECRPCGLHGHAACPKGHFKCALRIGVEDIAAT